MNELIDITRSIDISVYRFFQAYAGQWPLDHIAGFEEDNNLIKGGFFLAAYIYVWFRKGSDQEKNRRVTIAILTGTMVALMVCRAIADLAPFRIRPMFDPAIPHASYAFEVAPNMESWSSFPSDTAAFFFALAIGLAHLLRRYTAPLILYTAVWICVPRMFLGVHYLSDIVAGGAIGGMVVLASIRSEWLRSSLASRVLGFMDAKPELFYAAAFLVCFEMGALFDDIREAAHGLSHAISRGFAGGHSIFALVASGILTVALIAGYMLARSLNWFALGGARPQGGSPSLARQSRFAFVPSARAATQLISAGSQVRNVGKRDPGKRIVASE
jgi:undecaprenyl-diphosphatase